MERIKVGVVGVGYFGQYHAEKYAGMEGVELVGVADVDSSRVEEVAHRFQTRPFYDHRDLIDKVRAVSIAVPTQYHYQVTADFFNQGVDVLLEKPITSTLEEANRLIELGKAKGLILQIGQLERFNGAFVASKEIIQNPLRIESFRTSPFPGRGIDVNVVLDLMIHDIDILLSVVPSEVRQIHASGMPVVTPQLDTASARVEFENGCIANLEANRVAEEKVRKTRIHQANGSLTIDYLFQRASFSRRGMVSDEGTSGEPCQEIPVQKVDLLGAEIQSFLQSVRHRKAARVSGWDGRRALEVALKIVRTISEETQPSKTEQN